MLHVTHHSRDTAVNKTGFCSYGIYNVTGGDRELKKISGCQVEIGERESQGKEWLLFHRRKGFTNRVAFKQELEGREGVCHAVMWEEYSRQRNTKCEGPEVSWRIRMQSECSIVRCSFS